MADSKPPDRASRARGDTASLLSSSQLIQELKEARKRTLELITDLTDEQLMGPRMGIVNPLLWEIGHLTWFQERWTLRHLYQQDPIRSNGDALYDSARVAHDTRWTLPLPSSQETLAYMGEVFECVADRLDSGSLTKEPDLLSSTGTFP